MKPLALTGARVLVTGASSGIGSELARQFGRAGAELILVARRLERLESLADELRADGAQATAVAADLADRNALSAIVEATGDRVDFLVNNAGIGHLAGFVDVEAELVARTIDVNVTTHCRLARHYVPGMAKRGAGGVLTIASAAGLVPVPYMAIYGATKAFLVSFSAGLREELKPRGVRVTCVCPGPVRTDFFDANEMKLDSDLVDNAASAESVATFAMQALRRNRAVAVPGFASRMRSLVPSLLPRHVSGWLAHRVMQGRLEATDPRR